MDLDFQCSVLNVQILTKNKIYKKLINEILKDGQMPVFFVFLYLFSENYAILNEDI
jgi:hypothetical protein